jgi:hypothetical protein
VTGRLCEGFFAHSLPSSSAARKLGKISLLLAVLTAASVLVHGYHFGQQDAAIYVPAIKKSLDPSLYPYDSQFFLGQTRWMLFPQMVAASIRLTHLSLEVAVLLWHVAGVFLVLLAAWNLAGCCFPDPARRWTAVAMLAAARLLPVLGTKLGLTDRYLHPRDLALAAVLFAVTAALEKRVTAVAWLAVATVLHPTMALFGAFHVVFQTLCWPPWRKLACCVVPLTLAVSPAGDAWREVLTSRPYLFPLRWRWYELASVIAPLALLLLYRRIGQRRGMPVLAALSGRLALAGVIGFAVAVTISLTPGLEHLVPVEPARVLHLVYLLCLLLGGGLLGAYPRLAATAILLVGALFFAADRQWYPSSPHLEWPGRPAHNAWVEAFIWTRGHTPPTAFFALDPYYMFSSEEDAHGFRAFAERSMLADWVKDRSVAALTPLLAAEWREQVRDRERWSEFGRDDFRKLTKKYGVHWVLIQRSCRAFPFQAASGLDCPFVNREVAVCRVQ